VDGGGAGQLFVMSNHAGLLVDEAMSVISRAVSPLSSICD